MRPKLWISFASRPIWLWKRMSQHLPEGSLVDAGITANLTLGEAVFEDPASDFYPLHHVMVHAGISLPNVGPGAPASTR